MRVIPHKEGNKIIISLLLVLLILNAGVYQFVGKSWIFYTLLAISVLFWGVIVNFFRSPKRVFVGNQEATVVAPADGTIVVIEEVMENEYFHEKRLQVSIFMSVFNVHVNWTPVNGKIVHCSHQDGRFMAAYLPKSSTENERSTIVIERENGQQILMRQIAGAMARRIVTYATEGEDCRINEQMGFIKFGSRVDLYLPLDADIKVHLNQPVHGNQTIIAQL